MIDPFERTINYLRVSVTDRCDFRCTYCMSENTVFLQRKDVLTLEELERACAAFIRKGVRKLRITGGEPLVRRNILSLFRSLGKHLETGALDELALTTNGSQLEKYAVELFEAGVRRINISLDTLEAETFEAITRSKGSFEKVMSGIEAAKDTGFQIKINAVAQRGVNEDQVDALVSWCGKKGFDLTFIETMPLGEIGQSRSVRYLPLGEVRDTLERSWTLTDLADNTGGPSRYVGVKETGQRVGFITPLSNRFCSTCNRVRLTCTGTLFMCLGQNDSADLRGPIRSGESNEPLEAAIDAAIARKPKSHDFIIEPGRDGPALTRHMNQTGG